MVEGAVFIVAVIVALTEVIKRFVPQVSGAVTIGVSALVGLVVALVDVYIGVTDLTVAEGIMAGLAASGTVSVARAVSSVAPPKDVTHEGHF